MARRTHRTREKRPNSNCVSGSCLSTSSSTTEQQSAVTKRSYEDMPRTTMQDTSDIRMAACGQKQANVHVHHASPTTRLAEYKILSHAAARAHDALCSPNGRMPRAEIRVTERPNHGGSIHNSCAVMSKDPTKKSFKVGSRGKMRSLRESSYLPFCSRTGSVERAAMRKTRLRPAVCKCASAYTVT